MKKQTKVKIKILHLKPATPLFITNCVTDLDYSVDNSLSILKSISFFFPFTKKMSGPRTYGGAGGGGLYGADAPYGARFNPQAEQGLRVQNAYNAKDQIAKRSAKRKAGQSAKYSVPGADPEDTTDIHKYDLTFIETGSKHIRTKRRFASSVTSESTLHVSASLNELGTRGESKHDILSQIQYAGIAGTPAERNLLGEHDRHMLPVFNGGICQQINGYHQVYNPRDFLVFDVPEDDAEIRKIRAQRGRISGENPHRITPYLKPYDPKDQVSNKKFLAQKIIEVATSDKPAQRDPSVPGSYSKYSAAKFGDYLNVVARIVAMAQECTGENVDDIYDNLKNKMETPSAMIEDGLNGANAKSTMRVAAAMRFFMNEKDDRVGSPFTEVDVKQSELEKIQLFRYHQDRDNALEGLLACIKDATAMSTKNIVQIALTGAAPGRPYNGLILQ